MKIYGIKTCGSVKKAFKFFNDKNIEYQFKDLKKEPIGYEKIDKWLEKVDIDTLFNKRGTKYRQLKLKALNLNEDGMREWLCKENLLIKRPVIELDNGDIIVGFNEEKYKEIFR